MMWKNDEQVTAATKLPGWTDFHRACGRHKLFFDHIERDGKRGPYKATAFTVNERRGFYVTVYVADGMGKTPLEALANAYRNSKQPVADDELDRLLGLTAELDMEDILG